MASPCLPGTGGHRGAHTLTEVIVGVAVVVGLLGVLVPALLHSRESSVRLQCANNLKQIGLGFHSHHDALGIFPTGGQDRAAPRVMRGSQGPAFGPDQNWGWAYQVLPFLGQDALWMGPDDGVVAGTPVKVYFCPARRQPQVIAGRAMLDYAGISGGTTWFNSPDQDGMVVQVRRPDGAPLNRPVRLADVTDGVSNTLMVAEKRLNVAALGLPQDDDGDGYVAGFDADTMRYAGGPPLPDCITGTGDLRLGSSHPGYFLGVLADGSVRGFSYDLDLEGVFRPLCSRNDGQEFFLE
jgi:hypothetical protein